MADLYDRLNALGMKLTEQERDDLGTAAAIVRATYNAHKPDDAEDDLGEIADRLDTVAAPIVVVQK